MHCCVPTSRLIFFSTTADAMVIAQCEKDQEEKKSVVSTIQSHIHEIVSKPMPSIHHSDSPSFIL